MIEEIPEIAEESRDAEILQEIKEYAQNVGIAEASEKLEIEKSGLRVWIAKVGKLSTKAIPSKLKYVVSYFRNVLIPKIKDEETRRFNEQLHIDLTGRRLCVLFPCYKTTNPATAWSLVAMALDFGKEKIRFDMELGDADISNARNRLASRFLETGAEWSLWIDDDIIPPIARADWFKKICSLNKDFPDHIAGQHVIHRLVHHGKKIVSGVYFGRHPAGPPIFGTGLTNIDHNKLARAMNGQLLETTWSGLGCVLVHRDVYLDIQKKYPELSPEQNPSHRDQLSNKVWWDFFRKFPGRGEDVSFFERARECGHTIYVDTGLQCMHIGYCAWNATNTNNIPITS